ncbi:hypothetical protein A4H97_29705 [Niastella yeongjuensis]|uniref:YD repeat-containing protein n=1 Tax=Niastella yeongjuensis TaxID=354355 RepID=A0A1V9EPH7_9BACT|nr:hypothetical protein [Niastella yeongjuensis]OQP48016.1 hypothetical protein A4H97_29705 [Niastella yeongjuensis]SEO23590.1 YD repeat-containing protein [Niastella yeongjuensis]
MRILLLTILLVAISAARAQDTTSNMGNVMIASPTAASLGKFADVPVSYHTGTPNISIPVHQIRSGPLQLPITLSYHAGGVKVQENSSWVGAGWALNAGGVITRTVRGAPDDRGIAISNSCTNGYYSDYGYHNYLWRYSPGSFGVTSDGYIADDNQFLAGRKDGEPDLYFFNFGSYTGKFYFNDDRIPVLVPGADFKIQPDFAVGTGFSGFIITTPDGIKYYFGKTGNHGPVDPIEITVSGTLQYNYASANAAVSSWFLNKMVTADATDSITFEYASESYSYHTLSTFPIASTLVSYFGGPSNIEYSLVKNFVNGVRLSKISYVGGSLLFTPATSARLDLSGGFLTDGSLYDAANTESRALGSITIRNASGTICKRDSLYTSYWYDSTSGLNGVLGTTYGFASLSHDRYRLRLDSIQEIACDGLIAIPPHRFTYFSEPVPRRLTFGIDHWGFANGVDNNQTLIPTIKFQSTSLTKVDGANRDAAWPAMRGGALSRIDYPTGGYTIMDFEPHDTWCEYDTATYEMRVARNAGYTQSTASDTVYVTFNSAIYHVTLTNSSQGGSAQVRIYRVSDGWEDGLNANTGETKEDDFTLVAGNYRIVTLKNSPIGSGNGASMDIHEWVPHPVSGNMMVGGLRIKTMTNADTVSGIETTTNFSYRLNQNPGGHSTGILYSRPTYIQIIRNDAFGTVWGGQGNCSPSGCASCDVSTQLAWFKSPSSLRPLATTQSGNHIGYNDVYVSQPNNGKAWFRYYGSAYWDSKISDVCIRYVKQPLSCNTGIPNYPEAPLPFEPMRGELKYEGYYDSSGHIVKDIWHYPGYQQERLTTPGFISTNINNIHTFSSYSLASFRKFRDSTEETTYVPPLMRSGLAPDSNLSATVTKTTYYSSPFHYSPSRQVTISTTHDTLTTYSQYAFDYITPGCTPDDSTAYYMNQIRTDSANMVTPLANCSDGNCRYGVFQQYRRYISLDRQKLVNFRRKTFSDSARTVCLVSAKSGADYTLKPVLQLQEDYQNPLMEIATYRNGKTLSSAFTLYRYATDLTAHAYPWDKQVIMLRVPDTNFMMSKANNNLAVIKDSRYRDEAWMLYLNGKVADLHPRSSVTVSYIWDYKKTQPIAETIGAADSVIACTSFEADGTGNWTVGSAARLDTQAVTGRKSYQLSSGSILHSGLIDTAVYYLSYWTKNTSPFSISGTLGIPQEGATIHGWRCYLHTISGVGSVTLSGTGVIDELRLYPKMAQMVSFTYELPAGISSRCDARNQITYYDYDSFGRLIRVRDTEKNILKTIEYKYQIQSN